MKSLYSLIFLGALVSMASAQQVIKVGPDGRIFEPNPDSITFGSSVILEGATSNDYEITITATDPTADRTVTLPDASGVFTLSSALPSAAGGVSFGASSIIFEGATADAFETTLSAVDPTADQTLSLPNVGVSAALVFSTLTTNTVDAANSIWLASNSLVFEGASANGFELTVAPADVTADRTVTLTDASGVVTLGQASTATALAADDQAVAPGKNQIIQLSSDDATAANRTFTLSATGAVPGWTYVLIGPATNECELADTGIQKLSAAWAPTALDTLSLLFDGTNFIEVARSDN